MNIQIQADGLNRSFPKDVKVQRVVLLTITLLFMLFPGSSWAATSQVPSAAEASPDTYHVLMENDHVRVLVMELRPGQMDEWHYHPDETVYFEKAGRLKIHLQDGTSVTNDIPDGGVMWHEAWVHRVENIGKTHVRAIIVESLIKR